MNEPAPQAHETASADTDAPQDAPQFQMPLILLFVFGLPLFMTILWFFMQFTRPDRFGRVDRHLIDDLPQDEEEDPS